MTNAQNTIEVAVKGVEYSIDKAVVDRLVAVGLTEQQAVDAAVAMVQGSTSTEETPVVEEAVIEEAVVEEVAKKEPKAWFKKAVDNMTLPTKGDLLSRLIFLQLEESTSDKMKEEIQKEIDKLQAEDGDKRFARLMNLYIIKSKGWTVEATGKVAEISYLLGDNVEKGGTRFVKCVGKGIEWSGEQVVKAGQFTQKHSDKAGKALAAPFRITGDTINVLNGTKELPKRKK